MAVRRKRVLSLLTALAAGSLCVPALASAQLTDQITEGKGVHHPASVEGLQLANWVTASRDNDDHPFIVIDKLAAEVLVFNPDGLLVGSTPALVGIAPGDDASPGIGDLELSEIGPAEKTTPAGRFQARIGPAKGNQTVLWVDFSTSVALHAVVTGNQKEKRLERLQSPTPKDNRITFGCINVPAPFFTDLVQPLFQEKGGMVYILPERKFLIEVFPAFRVFAAPEQRELADTARSSDDRPNANN